MTTHYVIVSIKLSRDVLKDVYVSVCYFGGLFMNSFEATEGAYEAPSSLIPRSQEATEKPGLHTVEYQESQVKEPSTNFPNHDTHDKIINFPMLCNEHYDY